MSDTLETTVDNIQAGLAVGGYAGDLAIDGAYVSKITTGTSLILEVPEVVIGYNEDGTLGLFRETAGAAGGFVGAWAGAKMGSAAGAALATEVVLVS